MGLIMQTSNLYRENLELLIASKKKELETYISSGNPKAYYIEKLVKEEARLKELLLSFDITFIRRTENRVRELYRDDNQVRQFILFFKVDDPINFKEVVDVNLVSSK